MHGHSTWFRRSSGPRTSCLSPLWHRCRGQTCQTSTSWHRRSTPTSSRWTVASCQSRRSHSWRERLPFSYGPLRSFTQRTPCSTRRSQLTTLSSKGNQRCWAPRSSVSPKHPTNVIFRLVGSVEPLLDLGETSTT
jgi:hypothetical protein